MNTIIGIDSHISTCDYYAVNKDGHLLAQGTVKTDVPSLRRGVRQIKGKNKIVVMEQGPLAAWMGRVLKPHVSEVVLSETRRNRWIAKDPTKHDRFDAKKLATLYRGGFIKEIVQRDDRNEQLLRLVLQHHDLIRQRTRVKNKIKAKFRENGLRASGTSVFNGNKRQEWMKQLCTNKSLQFPVSVLFDQLDLLDQQICETDNQLLRLAKQYPIISVLIKRFPGIGLINACTFVALVDTPERFATVKKLWIYCGLGLDRRSSGKNPGSPRITRRGNRLLKCTVRQATLTAVHQDKNNPYRHWYEERVKSGQVQYKALLTCARKLAKDMWLTWRKHLRPVNTVK